MKYFYWFKGLILITLACSVTTQGSTVISFGPENNTQKNQTLTGYTVTVSAGQVQNSVASANLTISGENSKVSVEKKGTVTLVAGKSIVFHPGTIISNGGFLYASIEPVSKNGKLQKKQVKLVTVEEKKKIEEQTCLSAAAAMFSPFPTCTRGTLHAGDADNGSFTSSNNVLTAVSPEQQRKVAVDSRLLPDITRKQMPVNFTNTPVIYAFRVETMKVLRL
jgi:hypothetical protein